MPLTLKSHIIRLLQMKKSAPLSCANSLLERFSGRNMRDISPLARIILAHFCLKRKPMAKIFSRHWFRCEGAQQGGQKWLRLTAPEAGAKMYFMRS